MEIIPAEEKHIPEIVELWIEFMAHHKDIDPRFPMRKEAPVSFKKHLMELMKTGDNLILVTTEKVAVIGFSISTINHSPVWESETYGTIDTMMVKSEYRRKGIGEKMLNRIYDWFESKNIRWIELSVSARNEVGYSFWDKHGFKDFMHHLYLDR